MNEIKIKDVKGREITLRSPGVLAQYKLIEALGATASNETYTSMCMPLIYVAEIEGQEVLLPTSKREIEALITRLDNEGLAAVFSGVEEHFSAKKEESVEAAKK